MNPENLKVIVDLISHLGGDARTAFITYVVCETIRPILVTTIMMVGIYHIVPRISLAFNEREINDQTCSQLHELVRKNDESGYVSKEGLTAYFTRLYDANRHFLKKPDSK